MQRYIHTYIHLLVGRHSYNGIDPFSRKQQNTCTPQHITSFRERTSTSPGSEFRGCCFLARLVDHFLDSPNPVLNVAFIDGTLRARQINVHDDCVWACVFLSINRRL